MYQWIWVIIDLQNQYWPQPSDSVNIILQESKISYSLLQQHVIVLTVNVTYAHQQELMLNNRTCTNTRYNMELPGLHKVIFLNMISQPFGFITFDEIHVIIEITVILPNNGHNINSCYSIFSFMSIFCRSLFVLLSFFFWSLCCLFFFDIQILITPLVSSHSSYYRLDA